MAPILNLHLCDLSDASADLLPHRIRIIRSPIWVDRDVRDTFPIGHLHESVKRLLST